MKLFLCSPNISRRTQVRFRVLLKIDLKSGFDWDVQRAFKPNIELPRNYLAWLLFVILHPTSLAKSRSLTMPMESDNELKHSHNTLSQASVYTEPNIMNMSNPRGQWFPVNQMTLNELSKSCVNIDKRTRALQHLACWPNGKALDYGSRDCRFESCVGQSFLCFVDFGCQGDRADGSTI
ncbi:hypothetical protein BDV29DRAFT_168245 [Aspergillus leporis]|uniref:Uncharacterized protein n=1 Tax=Aspergillus leporis TaxID=41062 RepID=A0A5N5XDA0_9EURO|nr:hypothetical protein BDV29DRAFT_168245 [Aspergillus leporis]